MALIQWLTVAGTAFGVLDKGTIPRFAALDQSRHPRRQQILVGTPRRQAEQGCEGRAIGAIRPASRPAIVRVKVPYTKLRWV